MAEPKFEKDLEKLEQTVEALEAGGLSLDDALKQVKTEHAFIMGGAELYRTTIDRVDGIYLTRIHADFKGDVFYPEIPAAFVEKSRSKLQDDPLLEVVFYEKTKKGCCCCG